MNRIAAIIILGIATLCGAQDPLLLSSSFNSATASTPTFSPVAGAVTNPTTVTASSSTSGSGCAMYFDTSNPPTTAQSTYSVTTPVTLYAQLRGCSNYNNSAIASAAYTIAVPAPSVVHVSANYAPMNFGSGTVTLSSAATSGTSPEAAPVTCSTAPSAWVAIWGSY